jgi:hypothetical protein
MRKSKNSREVVQSCIPSLVMRGVQDDGETWSVEIGVRLCTVEFRLLSASWEVRLEIEP